MALYLEPHQLVSMLRGPEGSQVLVIDVRDEDFAGGHIKGALNIQAEHFHNAGGVDHVVDQHAQPPISKVVLHCMFSQQRGPRCALRLASRLKERHVCPAPTVYVLRGGFIQFAKQYGGEADLVEGLDAKVWGK